MSADELIDDQVHIRKKSMWAGSHTKSDFINKIVTFSVDSDRRCLSSLTVNIHRVLPKSKVKCFDELIVNAVDHIATCRNYDKSEQVSYIDIRFDRPSFTFSIENDGKGIDITRFNAPDSKYHNMYKPYVFFTAEKQGSNAHKSGSCIKAGVNGYGTKIVLANSQRMTVECINQKQRLSYRHEHYNDADTGKYILDTNPKVEQSSRNNMTKITFVPLTLGPASDGVPLSSMDFDSWIIFRVVYIAAYMNMLIDTFNLRPVRLTYNGMDFSWIRFTDIAESFKKENSKVLRYILNPKKKIVETTQDESGQYILMPMEIVLCLKKNHIPQNIISNTNGTLIYEGGHISSLYNQIIDRVVTKCHSLTDNEYMQVTKGNVNNSCMIFVNAILPGIEFGEQSKKNADLESVVCEQYVLDKECIDEIVRLIFEDVVLKTTEVMNKEAKMKVNISDKFIDACNRSKDRRDFTLLICEGDSALGAIKSNLSDLRKKFDINKLGFMTLLGGVPNSRKRSIKFNEGTNEEVIIMDNMSMNNVFLNTLQKALGIFINKDYDRRNMRYSKIICCMDQDHDGKGKLFGLVLNIIDLFWPELLRTGDFLYKLETPIKRIYSNNKLIKEFYYEHEYEQFVASGLLKKSYETKYFKGLGSNRAFELRRICAGMFDNIKSYVHDNRSEDMVKMFYEKDANPRKKILSRENSTAMKFYASMENQDMVPITNYLLSDLFLFAKDDILRKLVSAVDGLNKSGRKIVNGILKIMKKGTGSFKVVEIASKITKTQNYHHSEACLETNIKGKCFITVGGRQCPMMIPEGHFGSRACGGRTASQSRYLFVTNNNSLTNLLFPNKDMDFLHWTPEDGVIYEPDYFVPIVPMAILETYKTTASGWNFRIVARDIFEVIKIVKEMINGHNEMPSNIPMALHGFSGQYVQSLTGNYEETSGRYKIMGNKIRILELPYGKWIDEYILELSSRIAFYEIDAYPEVADIYSNHSMTLDINLGPTFWDKVEEESSGFVLKEMTKVNNANMELMFGKDVMKNKKLSNDKKHKVNENDAKKIQEQMAMKKLGNDERFSLASFLRLKKVHSKTLNLVDSNDCVSEFRDYGDIIRYWYPIRKDIYNRRVTREKTLRDLEIELLKNKVIFLDNYDYKRRTVDEQTKEFQRLGLKALNERLIKNPGSIEHGLYELCISDQINGDINYDYILNMSIKSTNTKSSIDKMKSDLIKKIFEYNIFCASLNAGQFPGASAWLDELEELENVLRKGMYKWWTDEDSVINDIPRGENKIKDFL